MSIGADLTAAFLTLSSPPDYCRLVDGASFAKKRAARPNQFAIHFSVDGEWHSIALQETTENFHHVQPFGRQEWLLVRGRADNDEDRNATVFDSDGRPARSFPAGDGIEHVQVSERKHIWVGYFDEGVFGDTDLGHAGLACLDSDGRTLLRFDHHCEKAGLPSIADCYAMNVCSDHEVWLYYYTDFPLVRLVNGLPAGVWHGLPVKGAHAIAVASNRVLFCGSYDKRNSLFMLHVDAMEIEEITLLGDDGLPLKGFRGHARRGVLFLSTPDALYRLDIDDL